MIIMTARLRKSLFQLPSATQAQFLMLPFLTNAPPGAYHVVVLRKTRLGDTAKTFFRCRLNAHLFFQGTNGKPEEGFFVATSRAPVAFTQKLCSERSCRLNVYSLLLSLMEVGMQRTATT